MAAFSQEKQKLFLRLLQEKGVNVSQKQRQQTVPLRNKEIAAPLSFNQEGLWFIDQLEQGKPTYNVPVATRITGPLKVEVLRQCLSEVVRRHESLRTTFPVQDYAPIQKIHPPQPISMPVVDLTELTEKERQIEALRLATEDAHKPLNLDQGPVMRASLLKLHDEEYVMTLCIHHIITDGWSFGVLSRELDTLYEAFLAGKPSPLPELSVQFADYAVWQRENLRGEVLEEQLAFWKHQLEGQLPVLQLPTDRQRPPVQSNRGQHQTLTLSESLTNNLRTLSKAEDVTLFVTLLTAFNVLLHSYSQQEDIIVGSPIANRNKSELEGLIGYFVNVLPFRCDLSGNPSFQELLRRVNIVAQEVYKHQELPFGKIVEAVQPERSASRNPVYQVMFTLLNPEHAPAIYGYGFRSSVKQTHKLAELEFTPMEVESGVTKFDLVVLLWDVPEGISGTFEYNADLFDSETIARLAANFEQLLNVFTSRPEVKLDEIKGVLI